MEDQGIVMTIVEAIKKLKSNTGNADTFNAVAHRRVSRYTVRWEIYRHDDDEEWEVLRTDDGKLYRTINFFGDSIDVDMSSYDGAIGVVGVIVSGTSEGGRLMVPVDGWTA